MNRTIQRISWSIAVENLFILFVAFTTITKGLAQHTSLDPVHNRYHLLDQPIIEKMKNARVEVGTVESEDNTIWFREAGFGMFIHWGLYSIPAGMWQGEPVKDNRYINPYAEHIMMLNKIPIAEYAKLANTFNPVDFNAEYIVSLAKKAGMKYLVYTTKHHDGFAMYDSKVSDYNIVK